MTPPRQVFEVFTLFPDAVEGFVRAGLLGRAIEQGVVAVHCTNPRDFTTDRHRTVDDAPFGGGAGMVIKPEPVVAALEHVDRLRGPVHRILLTPSAPRFDQAVAARLAELPRVGLLCGRYEGIDDRVREHFVDECLSIGDFVLGGGEVAALVIIEAVSRLAEGVLGNPDSAVTESFAHDCGGGLLEYPQYTRPAEFRGHAVPSVLLGGNHAAIEQWRRHEAMRRTWALRPDLRVDPPLPEGLEVHVLLPAQAPPEEPLVETARRHEVRGLALLQPEGAADQAIAWARLAAGKPAVASFRSLREVRRRFRRRDGRDPVIVDVLAEPTQDTVQAAAELRDRLASRWDGGPPVLVLRFRPPDDDGREPDDSDASFALPPPAVSSGEKKGQQGLATGPLIADASRPPFRLADWVDRVLTALRQQ